MDVDPFNSNTFSQKYVNGVNQNFPSKGNTFIAQETNTGQSLFNNASMRFTARNARFLFKEMENLPNLENCSGECANPYFIAGTDPICTSGTFSIPGLQREVALSWTVTPQNLVTPVATGNSVTLTRNGLASGVVTLTANLGAGCSAATSISRQVKIGLSSSDISIHVKRNNTFLQNVSYNPGETNKVIYTQTGNFNLTASASVTGANSFNWVIYTTGGYGYSNFNASGANCSFTLTGTNAPTIPLSVTVSNTLNGCTSSTTNYLVVVGSIPGARMAGISVSPNPATSTINLSIIDDTNDDLTASSKKEMQSQTPVRPFPSTGKTIVSLFEFNTSLLVRQWTQNEPTSKMLNYNIAGLRKGLYVLQVDRDNETLSTKLIIE